MMFMFHHLFWALQFKELPPATRLTVIYLTIGGALINDDLISPPDVPTREIKLSTIAAWVGCSEADLIPIVENDLGGLGFTAISIASGCLRYSLPELPEPAAPDSSKQPEAKLSIYVISNPRGSTKVGISNLVSKRVLDLQSANPMDQLSVAFEASGPARAIRRVEKKAHAALAEHLIGNEWFNVPPAQAIEVVKAMLELAGLTK